MVKDECSTSELVQSGPLIHGHWYEFIIVKVFDSTSVRKESKCKKLDGVAPLITEPTLPRVAPPLCQKNDINRFFCYF